ncbi:MAG TPA: DUF1697 domain-containing protein [Caulobacteraceae bacterium]|jgi:uncharacterized protein (DUF1697 family)|nr:DUF1697 domain-containing protein [Caulobacteraceae bacterium]
MSQFIALLRGVNVGGNGKLPMTELKALLIELGYDNPRTLLQSGNAVFGASRTKPDALETKLHKAIVERFAVNTELFVRTPQEWDAVVAGNPFKAEAINDPARLVAWVMKAPATAKAVEALRASNKGTEVVQAKDRTLYIYYPDGQGHSKLAMDRHMPSRGTGRNWNTVLKLQAMVSAAA